MPAATPAERRRFRRQPLILLVLTAIVYFAAINRGQAMLWGVGALLSATLLTGVLWPVWLVRGLTVRRTGPSRAAEGDTVRFVVRVGNPGWLPRFMVIVTDRLPFLAAAGAAMADSRQALGMIAYVPARGERRFAVAVRCERRGLHQLGPLRLDSSFPLDLREARRELDGGLQSLTVYPTLFPIQTLPLHGAPSQMHRGGYLLPEGAGFAEFSGLREYRRGDHPRHIHWPTSARLNELIVREYEPIASACVHVVLDQAAESDVGSGRESTFEYAVRIAASIARFTCDNGIRTRLFGRGRGPAPTQVDGGSGSAHFERILDLMAIVAGDGDTPYAAVLDEVGGGCRRGETLVVFLSQHRVRSAATVAALAALRTRGAHLLAVVFDQPSFADAALARPDAASAMAPLLDLGAACVAVRRGDDLLRVFNP